ncbi:MAG: hypothetical protein RLZZ66_919 [Pseudomonadota bacterium]|jgi:hypothetical protein
MMNFSTDSKSSLNILVIDGSCQMTNMLMRVLFCTGHCAKAFNTPSDALAALAQNPNEFDAIITDDFLNEAKIEMTGNVLIEALLEKSKLPILVWSSQVDKLKAVISDTSFLSFLHKPQDIKNIFNWLGDIKNSVTYKVDSAPVYQLIYASRVSDEFCEQDLMDILYISRKFNKLRNISGALIYHNHCFLQVLEGGEHDVKTLFNDHIVSDKRHKDVMVLNQSVVDKRDFRYWTMGFFGHYHHQEYALLGLTDFDTHPAGQFFKEKLTKQQKSLFGDF